MPSIGVGLCHWDLCVSRCCPPDWTQEEVKPRDRQELACSIVRTRICVHIWLQKPQRFLWLEVCSSPSESLICHFWYLMGFIYNLMVLVVNLVLNPTCKSNTNKVLSVHSIFKLSLEILNSYTVISYIRVRIRWFPSSLLLLTMVFGGMSAVYQAEAFEWELHGFWSICSDFLHNCCLMISPQIPEDGVRID